MHKRNADVNPPLFVRQTRRGWLSEVSGRAFSCTSCGFCHPSRAGTKHRIAI